MNKIIKNTLILAAITVVSGLVLGAAIRSDKRSDRTDTGQSRNRKPVRPFIRKQIPLRQWT